MSLVRNTRMGNNIEEAE